MSTGLMTPSREEWNEFIAKLAGPEGCNFGNDSDTWVCDNTFNRPITRRILKEMGCSDQDIEQSLGFLNAFGGHCDCEIVFNVESSFNSYMGHPILRPVRRKNSKRKTK